MIIVTATGSNITVSLTYTNMGKDNIETQITDSNFQAVFNIVPNQNYEISWYDPINDKVVSVITIVN